MKKYANMSSTDSFPNLNVAPTPTSDVTLAPIVPDVVATPIPDVTPAPIVPDVTPTPILDVTPTPIPDVTPAPIPDVTPAPIVPDVTPTPIPDVTPTPTLDVTPTPILDVTPAPIVPDVTPTPIPDVTPAPIVPDVVATPIVPDVTQMNDIADSNAKILLIVNRLSRYPYTNHFSTNEKLHMCRNFIISIILSEFNLSSDAIIFSNCVLKYIIRNENSIVKIANYIRRIVNNVVKSGDIPIYIIEHHMHMY